MQQGRTMVANEYYTERNAGVSLLDEPTNNFATINALRDAL